MKNFGKPIWFRTIYYFKQKNDIASNLINSVSKKFPARWIGCDAGFGSDMHFLKSMPDSLYCLADIKSNSNVFFAKPEVRIPPYMICVMLAQHFLFRVRERLKKMPKFTNGQKTGSNCIANSFIDIYAYSIAVGMDSS
nr:hypothetical protein [uncultured Desulfobacter sp.]